MRLTFLTMTGWHMDAVRRARSERRLARWATAVLAASIAIALSGTEGLRAQAHAPTFTKDVAPILYKNCTTCHRPGGLGPMSLLTYEGARQASAEMRDAVGTGYMPPWHADSPHGTFSNDRRLTDADKQTIRRWVDAGTPNGDAKDLPPAPHYPSGWTLGTPDAVMTIPAAYEVPANGTIEYQYFEVPTNFTEDKWVQAIEILPGAREVVHHVLVYARVPTPVSAAPPAPLPPGTTPPQPLLIRRDDHQVPDSPPGPDGEPRQLGVLIAGIAPGTDVTTFPQGTALRIRAGTVLTLQMHYTAHGHAMKDRSSVGFVFAKAPPVEEMRANAFSNGNFTIPAGATDHRVPSEIGFRESVKVWGLLPHTHLRGKRWEYRLIYPDGRAEPILGVPNYDFNWQTYYMFAKPIAVPAGARIEAVAWYDNSTANLANPNPMKDVKWGDQTWEEMQFTAFLYTVDSRRMSGPPK